MPDRRQVLERALERSARPAVLLAPVRVEAHRQLGRCRDAADVRAPPAGEMRAVRQIEILGERVVEPAACAVEGGPPPDARGAVEVEPLPRRPAAGLLDGEVAVDGERLQPREQREATVRVVPARLDEREPGIGDEHRHGPAQEVRPRHEVGVEDRQQLASSEREAVAQRARLEAAPFGAPDVVDVEAVGAESPDELADDPMPSRRWSRRGPGSRAVRAGSRTRPRPRSAAGRRTARCRSAAAR